MCTLFYCLLVQNYIFGRFAVTRFNYKSQENIRTHIVRSNIMKQSIFKLEINEKIPFHFEQMFNLLSITVKLNWLITLFTGNRLFKSPKSHKVKYGFGPKLYFSGSDMKNSQSLIEWSNRCSLNILKWEKKSFSCSFASHLVYGMYNPISNDKLSIEDYICISLNNHVYQWIILPP